MARLDVYPLPGSGGRGYVLDVQADLLAHLGTRTVVPLLPVDTVPPPIRDLNPIFVINGATYVLLTQAIATVPGKELGMRVMSLAAEHDQITRALDMLLLGF